MNKDSSQPNLAEAIQSAAPKQHRKRNILILVVLLILVILGIWFYVKNSNEKKNAISYTTQPLSRGNIQLTVTATGNLEPTNEVTVGSELSGTILEVYVDYNDQVTKGQALAKLDTQKLSQQTEASRALLEANKAQVAQCEATVRETQATLKRLEELKRISNGAMPSQADMDSAIASADRANADLLSAKAAVLQTQAEIAINETDLSKAVIKSPINGIILTRDIEPGQTVAASFNTPELFVIAENLEQMKLSVAVAEADIGRVASNQSATFTVDAWPGRRYDASVLKVSFGSNVTDNVVTYETELEVNNNDLSLRPGMTATADIHVAKSNNTFLVPITALRFNPQSAESAQAASAGGSGNSSFVNSLMPRPPRRTRGGGSGEQELNVSQDGHATIWVLRNGEPHPIKVTIGLNDGSRVEVLSDELSEGMQVITRSSNGAAAR